MTRYHDQNNKNSNGLFAYEDEEDTELDIIMPNHNNQAYSDNSSSLLRQGLLQQNSGNRQTGIAVN